MTTARITAKQAVEFLKIHQLRRENAAIYQGIEALRGEVSTMHEKNDCTQKAAGKAVECVESLKNSHTAQLEAIERLKKQFELVSSENNVLRESTEKLKADLDKTAHAERTVSTRLEKIHLDSEKRSIGLEDSFKHEFRSLKDKIALLDFQIHTKTSSTETAALQEQLKALENNIRLLQHENRSVSRVNNSVEGRHSYGSKAGTLAAKQPGWQDKENDENTRNDPPIQHSLHDGGDMMLSVEQPTEVLVSSTTEDFDQRRNLREISYIDHSVGVSDAGDSMTMLPPPQPNENHVVDSLLSMRQQPPEKAGEYLLRYNSILESLPEAFEELFLTRFVEGLSDTRQREQMRRWLDTSIWSVANAKDFIHLCEHRTKHVEVAEAQEMIACAKSSPLYHAVQELESRIELREAKHGNSEKSRSGYSRLEQRRSQRLAELRSRHKGEDRGNIETETTQKDRTRTPQPRKITAKSSSSANKRRSSAVLRDSKGRFKAQKKSNQAKSASRKTGETNKSLAREQDANILKERTEPLQCPSPKANNAQRSSDLNPREKKKEQLTEAVCQRRNKGQMLVPRLVATNHPSNSASKEQNNPESPLVLPQTPRVENPFVNRGEAIKRKRKNSIGPPPEIPILSTTTDESRSF